MSTLVLLAVGAKTLLSGLATYTSFTGPIGVVGVLKSNGLQDTHLIRIFAIV